MVDAVDKRVWDLVTMVPVLSKPMAITAAVLNFFIAGLGTCFAACVASDNVSKTQLTIALFQFLTAFLLVGYFLSWHWAYLIVKAAFAGNSLTLSRSRSGNGLRYSE